MLAMPTWSASLCPGTQLTTALSSYASNDMKSGGRSAVYKQPGVTRIAVAVLILFAFGVGRISEGKTPPRWLIFPSKAGNVHFDHAAGERLLHHVPRRALAAVGQSPRQIQQRMRNMPSRRWQVIRDERSLREVPRT